MTGPRQIALLAIALMLGACPAPKDSTGQPGKSEDCPGANPGVVPINIVYEKSPIVVAPMDSKANEGDELQFNLVGANDVWVSTAGKTPEAGWLNGSGRKQAGKPASRKFSICVPFGLFPEGTEPGTEKAFGYDVNAVGKPELDPVVTVRKL